MSLSMPRLTEAMFSASLLLLLICPALGGPAKQRVTQLPGAAAGSLKSAMYAGHVDAGTDGDIQMYHHYVYFESENDPANDPLIVWTNGGPGAASFFGLFVELGPFFISDESTRTAEFNATGVPTLFRNEHAWTRQANVLILNGPPPVGYSYCDPAGPKGDGYSCGDWDDERTAVHNYAFLKNWLDLFPELHSNGLFLVGESYAGIYVPTLAREILKDEGGQAKQMLKGIAIGDGCVGQDVLCGQKSGPFFNVEFMHGHGQFSDKLYDTIQVACPHEQLVHGVDAGNAACTAALDEMDRQVGGYFGYSLYDDCWYENDFRRRLGVAAVPQGWRAHNGVSADTYWGPPRSPAVGSAELGAALNDYPCGGMSALRVWLNTTAVRAALHVGADDFFFSGDNGVGFNYTLSEKNLMPFYNELSQTTDVRVLIYNGDTDPGINSLVTQNWTVAMGLKETEPWTPWTLDGKQRMGGYVTRYEAQSAFDFLTIRGSGHMVPEYKPAASFEMLKRFLNNEPWQPYVAPSSQRGRRGEL